MNAIVQLPLWYWSEDDMPFELETERQWSKRGFKVKDTCDPVAMVLVQGKWRRLYDEFQCEMVMSSKALAARLRWWTLCDRRLCLLDRPMVA